MEKLSGILCPLDTEARGRLVPAFDMELHAFAAVPVPGAILFGTDAVLFDVCHRFWIRYGDK